MSKNINNYNADDSSLAKKMLINDFIKAQYKNIKSTVIKARKKYISRFKNYIDNEELINESIVRILKLYDKGKSTDYILLNLNSIIYSAIFEFYDKINPLKRNTYKMIKKINKYKHLSSNEIAEKFKTKVSVIRKYIDLLQFNITSIDKPKINYNNNDNDNNEMFIDLRDEQYNPEQNLIDKEILKDLKVFLDFLTDYQKCLLIDYYINHINQYELSKKLNTSQATISRDMKTIRKTLKETFKKFGYSESDFNSESAYLKKRK